MQKPSLEQENAQLKREIKSLVRDIDDAIALLQDQFSNALRTNYYREGLMMSIWEAMRSLRETDAKVVKARICSVSCFAVLSVGINVLLEHEGIVSGLANGLGYIIALLLGWRTYKLARRKMSGSRITTDEAIIFSGLFTASIYVLAVVVLASKVVTYGSIWHHPLIATGSVIVMAIGLFLILTRQQRELNRLCSYALFQAIRDNCAVGAKRAIEEGAMVNIYNRAGESPLQMVIECCPNSEILKMLIEAGANVHIRNKHGATTLHYAVWVGDLEVARMLFERQVDVNAADSRGLTPLHSAACRADSIAIVKELIAHGADVNAVASFGHTPLHYAWVNMNMEIAGLLLDAGAEDEDHAATWVKEHRYHDDKRDYCYGNYNLGIVMQELHEGHPNLRRHGVLASDLYTEVSEDDRNPKLAA